MTIEGARYNLIHAVRWNDMPKKEALEIAIQTLDAIPKIKAELKEWGEDACVKEHGCYDEVMEILNRYLPDNNVGNIKE